MLFLYILLGLVAAVLIVLLVPVYARITYVDELMVTVRVLGIPFVVLPQPDKPSPAGKKAKNKTEKKPAKAKEPSRVTAMLEEIKTMFREDGAAAVLHYLGELARLAGQAVGRVLRTVTVDRLQLELLVAAGDPADTAVRYGQVCGVLYPALTAIGGAVRIRRQQLRIEPNFLLEKSALQMDVRLHVSVLRLLGVILWLLWRFLTIKEEPISTTEHKEVARYGKQ